MIVGYAEWTSRHAAVFALSQPGDSVMFAAWHRVFDESGYSVAELHEATRRLSSTDAQLPKTRTENLAGIHRAIREARQERLVKAQRESEVQDGASVCEFCRSTGWVIVPHPRSTHGGKWVWPWYTLSVICTRCRVGQRVDTSMAGRKDGQRALRMDQYEALIPWWYQAKCERKQLQAAQHMAMEASRKADRLGVTTENAFDRVIARIKNRLRQPGDEDDR